MRTRRTVYRQPTRIPGRPSTVKLPERLCTYRQKYICLTQSEIMILTILLLLAMAENVFLVICCKYSWGESSPVDSGSCWKSHTGWWFYFLADFLYEMQRRKPDENEIFTIESQSVNFIKVERNFLELVEVFAILPRSVTKCVIIWIDSKRFVDVENRESPSVSGLAPARAWLKYKSFYAYSLTMQSACIRIKRNVRRCWGDELSFTVED